MANKVANPRWQHLRNSPVVIIMVVWPPLSPALPAQYSVYQGTVFVPAKVVVADTAGYGSHGVEICDNRQITKSSLHPAEVQLPASQIDKRPVSIGIGACQSHVRNNHVKLVPPMTIPWTM